jgi:hypothetical protein
LVAADSKLQVRLNSRFQARPISRLVVSRQANFEKMASFGYSHVAELSKLRARLVSNFLARPVSRLVASKLASFALKVMQHSKQVKLDSSIKWPDFDTQAAPFSILLCSTRAHSDFMPHLANPDFIQTLDSSI